MSLPRISFLEGWERNPAALLRRGEASDTESDTYQDLPETASLSSSFPSTYSRLNFNPYAGPGWNETTDEHDDRSHGSLGRALSPRRGRLVWSARQVLPLYHCPGQSESPWGVQVVVAVIYCFLAAGIVFGFAALKPVLLQENVYRNRCSRKELEDHAPVCAGQEIQLNLMFTIAAVATNVEALPVGTILDAYGPRVCGLIGSMLLAIGAGLFAFADQLPFDGYIPGYLLLALGGPFVFISSFHLSNTFPTRSGLILSTLTGAFDASSALFLIFRLLNQHTNGSISIKKFFLAYLAAPVFIAVAELAVMPKTSYKTAGELVHYANEQAIEEMNDRVDDSINDHDERERQRNSRRTRRASIVHRIQDLFDDRSSVASTAIIDDTIFNASLPNSTHNNATTSKPALSPNASQTNKSGVWGVLHGQSALSQLRTPWFILITLFTVLMMLRINYFVATLRQQYTYLLSPALATEINTVFDILLPVGGLLSIPFIGTFLDTLQTRTVLAILMSTATLIGILGCIPHSRPAAYGNIILFVLYRPFYYTAVSDYAAKVFGFQTFGKVYGLIICLAGVGNFAQAGLDSLTLRVFEGNPIPVNVGLTVLVAGVGGALVGYVSWQTKVLARDGAETVGETVEENGAGALEAAVRDWESRPLLSEGQERRAYGSSG
ncbi:hypothetical protein N7468_006235 [Penicillium chermesinum]|uniref:MFS transporter Fmp42 n=1 Tax=Penicillium chermesinum TaxID=63820 RepID=A0A9W9NRX5_9EURO|nr:uncharacterized protein N7468_006235 [Penicillium chermesinum]KAJ5225010.1 hypothetical protein N7468_006235 [Penicillium chermesinum]